MRMFVGDQRIPSRIERRSDFAVMRRRFGSLRLLQRDLLVQQIPHVAVEVRVVGTAEHHGQVAAVLPVRLRAKLRLDLFVEFRARQRIGNADADVIRNGLRDQFASRQQIGQLLAQIAQLDEEAHADAVLAQPRAGRDKVRDFGALVHRVQHALAAALRAKPGLRASGVFQGGGHPLADQVGAGLDGERDRPVGGAKVRTELRHPVDVEAEDVVRQPDVIGLEHLLQVGHLGRDVFGTALVVVVAPDRFGAPVAAERAASRRRHVEAEIAVPLMPHRPIAFDVDQIPGRAAHRPWIRRHHADSGQLRLPVHRRGDAGDAGYPVLRVDIRIPFQPSDQCDQRRNAFADQHGIGACREKGIRVVGSVGARDDHARAAGACFSDHLAGRFAHAAQAHLGQVVEVVLVDDHHVRSCGLQRRLIVLDTVGKHRVEQCDLVPHLPQECSNLDGGQRRIGLAALPLFRVVTQEIGVADLNLKHLEEAS